MSLNFETKYIMIIFSDGDFNFEILTSEDINNYFEIHEGFNFKRDFTQEDVNDLWNDYAEEIIDYYYNLHSMCNYQVISKGLHNLEQIEKMKEEFKNG